MKRFVACSVSVALVVSLYGCSRGESEVPYVRAEPVAEPVIKAPHFEEEPEDPPREEIVHVDHDDEEDDHQHEYTFDPEKQPKCVEISWSDVLRCKHCDYIHNLEEIQALVVVREEYWNEDGLEANWAINERDIREEIAMGYDTVVFLPANAQSFNSCDDMGLAEGHTNVWFKVYALYYDGIPRDLSWPVNPHHTNYRTSYDGDEERLIIKDHDLYYNEQEMAASVKDFVPDAVLHPGLVEWIEDFADRTGYLVGYGEYPMRKGGVVMYDACDEDDLVFREAVSVSNCFASDSPYYVLNAGEFDE